MVQIVIRNLASLLLRLACHVLAVILDESKRREERSCSMIKTTTKTNFTKSVKYKVGTIKSIADLLATKAMSEGDLTGLEAVYRSACDQLEKFVMYENGSLTASFPTSGDTKKISEIDPETHGLGKFCEKAYHTSDPDEAARLAASGVEADDAAYGNDALEKEDENND